MNCVAYSKRTPCIGFMKRVGLKEQNDRLREYAAANDLKITRFYEDKSDDQGSETGYQELRRDGMHRKFDLVIFESMYRFGVTTAESRNLLLHTFFLIGINFIIIEDGIDSRNETFDSLNSYFETKTNEIRGNLSWETNLSKQRLEYFSKGNYGYLWDKQTESLVVDEEAAEVIREIFRLSYSGITNNAICRRLTDKGIETPSDHMNRISGIKKYRSSGKWEKKAISRILSEERYIGFTESDGTVFAPIISEALFREINSRPSNPNTLSEEDRLFINLKYRCSYIDSTKRLYTRNIKKDYVKTHYIFVDKRPLITRVELLHQVKRAINREKRNCFMIIDHLNTAEAAEYMEAVERNSRLRSLALYEEAVEAQKDNLRNYKRMLKGKVSKTNYLAYRESMLKEEKRISDEFAKLVDRLEYRRAQFSIDNEWIQRFINIDVDDISPETLKKVLNSVVIDKDGCLDINLNTKGRDVFPRKWFILRGGIHGT